MILRAEAIKAAFYIVMRYDLVADGGTKGLWDGKGNEWAYIYVYIYHIYTCTFRRAGIASACCLAGFGFWDWWVS